MNERTNEARRTMANTFKIDNRLETVKDHIDTYMKFMYNQWTEHICRAIFGAQLGDHIWAKWMGFREDQGVEAAIFNMWFALDHECTHKLLDFALQFYGFE